jgi:hypothetical protein
MTDEHTQEAPPAGNTETDAERWPGGSQIP